MIGLHSATAPTINRASAPPGRRAGRRSGQVLVEFAFISLAFYLLFAGTVELGRALHASQALQNAARVCARELSVTPMPATMTFETAFGLQAPTTPEETAAADQVRTRIFDAGRLVLDVSGLSGAAYDDRLATLPLVNRMLVPLMIRERISIGGTGERDVLRYPGAIFANPNFDALNPQPGELGYLVRIPRITARDDSGHETIEWVDVVSEIKHSAGEGPFSVTSSSPHRGLVAVRLFYPFQAATLSAYSDANSALEADDSAVTATGPAPVSFTSTSVGQYSGTYGLGSQQAMTKTVRPFRRLLSAQSIFRREVFQ